MEVTLHHEHAWDLTPREAIAAQKKLAPLVEETPLPPVETVAGIDVSIQGDEALAAIAVVRVEDLQVVDHVRYRCAVPFPYISGLLSFREIPAILPALEQLQVRPDVLMTDSQGIAHPRRLGLAAHLGVLLDWPAIGVAKSRLTGRHEEPGTEKGSSVPLTDRGEVIGRVVRTRTNVKPVYVSIGHRATLEEAVALTLRCTDRYKLPEPTHRAHRLSKYGRL